MSKEEVLQLKKELIILKDYPEVYNTGELNNNLSNMEKTAGMEYEKLINEDKTWVDYNFNEWLDFYLGNSCPSGCDGCSCNFYE
jgi:hypothetical protein